MTKCDYCSQEATLIQLPNPADAELSGIDQYSREDAERCRIPLENWCKSCYEDKWLDV